LHIITVMNRIVLENCALLSYYAIAAQ